MLLHSPRTQTRIRTLALPLSLFVVLACADDTNTDTTTTFGNGETGDGDGDPTTTTTGDGDGDPTTTGDGDGDPTTTGDGDGDPTTTGDGDGDPTTTGDGDGDPTTTGDGDGDMTTTGDGDGDMTTTGDGDGDMTTTGDGDGDMTTTGDGDGDMTTTGDGDGDPNLVEVELLAEDFDGLPNTNGASDLASFQAALPSWGMSNSNASYQVSGGTSTTGAIYSYGTVGTSERALGGLASNPTNAQGWGVCITNASAADYQDIMVSYVGEQWRDSGNAMPHTLVFAYTTSPTIAADLQMAGTVTAASGVDVTMEWVDLPGLDFTGPKAVAAGALDGNADDNRAAIGAIIPNLVLAPSEVLCLRWRDPNDANSDHGLAIDDLVVTAMTPG